MELVSIETPIPEQPISNDSQIALPEIQQIENMEQAFETLLQTLETLAQKELKTAQELKRQESIVKEVSQENEALKQENQKLQSIIKDYMGNFKWFYTQTKENLESDKVNSMVQIEQKMNELIEKIASIENKNTYLEVKNLSLAQENQELKNKLELENQNIGKLNAFIFKNFEDMMSPNPNKKNKTKDSKSKKHNSARKSRKDSVSEVSKSSPIQTRHRGTRKTNPVEDEVINEFDNEEDQDFQIDISEDSFDEEEEEEAYAPKKGKRKVGSGRKAGVKKVKKNENKEILAQNRNTIQYHLFN